MKKALALILALTMVLSLFVGCGKKEEAPAPEAGGQPEAADKVIGDHDNNIVVVLKEDIASLDPAASASVANHLVSDQLFSRLYANDENYGAIPELVEEKVIESDTSFVFKIYEGVKFSDGTDLTSEDVVASINRARESATGKSLLTSVTGVEAVDEYKVRVTLNGIFPSLEVALSQASTSIMPKEYIEACEASGDWSKPIGSGRYTLKERNIGDSIVLVKNENYFNPEDAAQNDSLTYKVIPEGVNRTIMIESGAADLNVDFLTADYDRAMSTPGMKIHEHPSANKYYVGMDNENEYMKNIKVRQAVNYAIDRAAVLEAGFDGFGKVTYTNITPACIGYVEKPNDYSYDLEKAKALMAEAGYANGFEIDLLCWNDTLQRIAEVVQAYLGQINIKANIKRIESAVRSDVSVSGGMPMCVGNWTDYQDPDLFLGRLLGKSGVGGSNYARFQNDEFEKLYLEGKSTYDIAEREAAYEAIQELVSEEAPWCTLFVADIFALANADLQGVELSTESAFNFHKLHY